MNTPYLSVVIPLFNEVDNLNLLYKRLVTALDEISRPYEIIFVDDGSTDGSGRILEDLFKKDEPHIKVIQFRRNFGKTAALNAGFAQVQGEIVITMDADLQDDPAEIPHMLDKLYEGYDLVAAWRVKRQDTLDKTLPSRIFNLVVSTITGVELHDFNCGFKTYRRVVTDSIKLYGDLHRFIPVLAHQAGFRLTELAVQHHPRHAGVSKYGAGRLMKGFLDFAMVLFLITYLKRPLRLFGGWGVGVFAAGSFINLYLAGLWFLREFANFSAIGPIGTRPLLIVGVLAMIAGIQLVSMGLLGEMLRYFGFRAEEEYTIRRVLTGEIQSGGVKG